MNTDIESIAHLDFDLSQDKAEKCRGWQNAKRTKGNGRNCPNAAKVYAVRSCCGHIETLCLKCYNEISIFHAADEYTTHRINDESPNHHVGLAAFVSVEFIK